MIFRCLGQQDLGIYPEYNLQQYCQLVAPRPTEGHQTALALQLQQHMQQSSQMKQMPSSQQNQQSNQQSQQQNTQQNTQQMQQNQQMQQMQQMQQQMQSQQNTSGARWSCQELAAAATKNRFVDGFEFQVPEKKILELAQVWQVHDSCFVWTISGSTLWQWVRLRKTPILNRNSPLSNHNIPKQKANMCRTTPKKKESRILLCKVVIHYFSIFFGVSIYIYIYMCCRPERDTSQPDPI